MSRKQSGMTWWYYHGDDVILFTIMASIVGGVILSMHLVNILYAEPLRKELELQQDTMYNELCQDERFYYLDSHAQECYKRGIKR